MRCDRTGGVRIVFLAVAVTVGAGCSGARRIEMTVISQTGEGVAHSTDGRALELRVFNVRVDAEPEREVLFIAPQHWWGGEWPVTGRRFEVVFDSDALDRLDRGSDTMRWIDSGVGIPRRIN